MTSFDTPVRFTKQYSTRKTEDEANKVKPEPMDVTEQPESSHLFQNTENRKYVDELQQPKQENPQKQVGLHFPQRLYSKGKDTLTDRNKIPNIITHMLKCESYIETNMKDAEFYMAIVRDNSVYLDLSDQSENIAPALTYENFAEKIYFFARFHQGHNQFKIKRNVTQRTLAIIKLLVISAHCGYKPAQYEIGLLLFSYPDYCYINPPSDENRSRAEKRKREINFDEIQQIGLNLICQSANGYEPAINFLRKNVDTDYKDPLGHPEKNFRICIKPRAKQEYEKKLREEQKEISKGNKRQKSS